MRWQAKGHPLRQRRQASIIRRSPSVAPFGCCSYHGITGQGRLVLTVGWPTTQAGRTTMWECISALICWAGGSTGQELRVGGSHRAPRNECGSPAVSGQQFRCVHALQGDTSSRCRAGSWKPESIVHLKAPQGNHTKLYAKGYTTGSSTRFDKSPHAHLN